VSQTNNNLRTYEKLRKEKSVEVEQHSLARGHGIAGFLEYRLRLHQVSLADRSSPALLWLHARLQ